MSDMTEKMFEDTPCGRAAMRKFGKVHEDFRIFEMGRADAYGTFFAKGQVFRKAKSGPYKGKLSVPVKGTLKETYISASDFAVAEAAEVAALRVAKH